jgi:hypothetical protein
MFYCVCRNPMEKNPRVTALNALTDTGEEKPKTYVFLSPMVAHLISKNTVFVGPQFLRRIEYFKRMIWEEVLYGIPFYEVTSLKQMKMYDWIANAPNQSITSMLEASLQYIFYFFLANVLPPYILYM